MSEFICIVSQITKLLTNYTDNILK